MPEEQPITYEEVFHVLEEIMEPITIDEILNEIHPYAMTPGATQDAKNIILQHLEAGQAAGDIHCVDDTYYYVMGPIMEQIEEEEELDVAYSASDSLETSDENFDSEEDYDSEGDSESDYYGVEDMNNDQEAW